MEDLSSLNDSVSTDNNIFKFSSFKKKFYYFLVFLITLFVFIYFLFFSIPSNFPINYVLNIKENSSLRYTSKYLQEINIIRSRVVFETIVIILGGEKYITSGDYFFENKLSVFKVARRIVKGERHIAPVKVTIPEGFNISDISKLFVSKLPNFNKEKFLLEAGPQEGYLFPDTYFFLTTDNEEDVLLLMSNNFKKRIVTFQSSIATSGKSEKEIIVMASLIEEESKGDVDRKIISGILWKRISIGMPLQVDAEPNTYKVKGLPLNPISNPGIKAIEAAIYPESSNYLYYLHDKNGNIHYARTFEEHKLNKQRYLK
ncbi:MAG: Aminodeoxychorismate lyase [Candidatus Nomurabacteria bacterium GW2011_GWE1_32_28]|uniref:Aminodeoxychorismate lyase n=1 Tax=Candidatus Nomurabacteria bacterium GW2011_GWF1_31_48 TaxID=1618767 RepID=A0A0F9YGC7_9BACT|nr:MAG: Aminodeoxychorismate lyase [Candidatus Nomurabacteria bacterium GW2011_GWF2_30_133]KKP28916.1 MAG: Aminodeoxychorismate lyase [Candidatus Nomurabacteria bacterium GW2011_GWE2_31_40]KKP30654.1 MAG: Aminodeoxychorismate lyase [Candidatus Nomurabacteria bacterium GW2011_GWF1_31_48]KKP35172.1 MAG: Aminodeoxychorismate lyase [Candidatus Nomurabacteria bacterium GW2011_GWE1_32_28]HAS80481.1 hypothetical protein [Candidatus Nomurabacteria bacterium]